MSSPVANTRGRSRHSSGSPWGRWLCQGGWTWRGVRRGVPSLSPRTMWLVLLVCDSSGGLDTAFPSPRDAFGLPRHREDSKLGLNLRFVLFLLLSRTKASQGRVCCCAEAGKPRQGARTFPCLLLGHKEINGSKVLTWRSFLEMDVLALWLRRSIRARCRPPGGGRISFSIKSLTPPAISSVKCPLRVHSSGSSGDTSLGGVSVRGLPRFRGSAAAMGCSEHLSGAARLSCFSCFSRPEL